jgi:protease I
MIFISKDIILDMVCKKYPFHDVLWRIKKMKRLTILSIILACFAVLCFGQRRSRTFTQTIIQLSDPKQSGSISFEEALTKQRNVNQFDNQPLERSQIGQLAWAGLGVVDAQTGLRTVPVAGPDTSIQLLFATNEGLFVYQTARHSLEQSTNQDVRMALASAAPTMGQSLISAGCDIIIAGSSRQLTAQFGTKARSVLDIEAGRIAQNIQLQAVCLGLGFTSIANFDTKAVIKICNLPRDLEPVYIMCAGNPLGGVIDTGKSKGTTSTKRALLIVPSVNFQDAELFETKTALDNVGVQTVIASSRKGILKGSLGGQIEASVLINQIKLDDFDAVIFIGGPGAAEYVTNVVALDIARQAVQKRKIVAAISTAPSILANAGVLPGVRATGFLGERDLLIKSGAIYTGLPVEQDKSIITANEPVAALQFGRAIADAIVGK